MVLRRYGAGKLTETGLSEGFEKTFSASFFSTAFAYRFNEAGANAGAVREAANFPDSPFLL
jgi:hypothetical protein